MVRLRTATAMVSMLLVIVCCLAASVRAGSDHHHDTRDPDCARARAGHHHTSHHAAEKHSHHGHHHRRHAHEHAPEALPPSPKAPKEWSASTASRSLYTGWLSEPTGTLTRDQLPKRWDWCDTPQGRSFCTPSWNQHIPEYCGSCYVHGALHAANDRIKLLMDGKHDMQLARQVIINCGPSKGLGSGCDGGEVFDVFEFMYRYGLPDESCQNYVARAAHSDPQKCSAIDVCMNCMPSIKHEDRLECWEVSAPIKYYITEYGLVSGELAMMNEIHARGPITCAFASVDDFDYSYRGGVYVDRTNASDSNHDVEVVGWGTDEESGLDYWRARNSWGENSFFKILRGSNNMRFEEECVFALFDVSELQAVLDGRHRGGMFGVVNRPQPSVTIRNETDVPPKPEKPEKNDSRSKKDEKPESSAAGKTNLHESKEDARSDVNNGADTSDPDPPSTRRDNSYWKARYAPKKGDHEDDDGDDDFNSKTNVNLNLNLNLDFKRGKAIVSKIDVKRKTRTASSRTRSLATKPSQRITGAELDRQLSAED